MLDLVHLSKLFYLQLIRKKGFMLSVLIMVSAGFFVIPGEDANYATFQVSQWLGYANDAWVGSTGAVFSNLLLSFIGFFFLEGIYREDIHSGMGLFIRSSERSNAWLLFSKALSYFMVLTSLMCILIAALYAVNANNFNLLVFLSPFLYYSVPYLVFLSGLIVLTDYFITSRGLAITLYLLLIFCLLTPFFFGLDPIGVNDFARRVSEVLKLEGINLSSQPMKFNIGYLQRSADSVFSFDGPGSQMNSFADRLPWVFVSMIALLAASPFFRRYQNKRSIQGDNKDGKQAEPKDSPTIYKPITWNRTFPMLIKRAPMALLQGEWLIFKHCFGKVQIIAITLLWIAAFGFRSYDTAKILLGILLLLAFPLFELYINLPNRTNMQNHFKLSLYSLFERLMIRCGVLTFFFALVLTPVLIHRSAELSSLTLLYFFLITAGSLTYSHYIKGVKLIEIVYIVLFASYVNGTPLLKLF